MCIRDRYIIIIKNCQFFHIIICKHSLYFILKLRFYIAILAKPIEVITLKQSVSNLYSYEVYFHLHAPNAGAYLRGGDERDPPGGSKKLTNFIRLLIFRLLDVYKRQTLPGSSENTDLYCS